MHIEETASESCLHTSLFGTLEHTAQLHPRLNALNFIGLKFSYQLLLIHVNAFAAALENDGIRKGDVVSIMLPNCPQAVIAFYAANKIGAIANVIHPLMSESELEYSLNLVGTKLLVTMDIVLKKAEAAIAGSIRNRGGSPIKMVVTHLTDELPVYARAIFRIRAGKEQLNPARIRESQTMTHYRKFIKAGRKLCLNGKTATPPAQSKDLSREPAAILFSGGTSGTPKGILLSNGNINTSAWQVGQETRDRFIPGDRMLGALPLFHGFGLAVCLHTAMMNGLECMLVPRLTVEEYSKVLLLGKCNYVIGVPTLLGKIADLPSMQGADLSFVKEVISGGDALPAEMRERLNRHLTNCGSTTHVREGYGATECVAACAVEPSCNSKEGSIGRILAGNSCKIIDPETMAELPCGCDGELLVSGPTVMMGYWNNPEETAKTITVDPDGTRWLHTGDIACQDEDGFIFYKGRIKRMIISSGYNIYPNQVEHELNKLPQVASSCVIAIPDEYRLHRIKAFVIPTEGVPADEATKRIILDALKTSVARYAWPKELEFRESLPLTKVGKIAYRELEEEEEQRRRQPCKQAQPETEVA
ncbi:MAG: class I adenylate-forming enzyme family protein [Eggerthellaceae bacterium]|nr:class I adenylate-forming enzyme family protein [Eggerthellaceae bacterium]